MAAPAARLSWQLLHRAGFRRLYRCRLMSQAGDGVLEAALVSFVVFSPQREASAGAIAVALAVTLLPYCAVEPVTGILLDRVRRRQVLVWANAIRALLCLGLALLAATHHSGPGFLTVALLVFSVQRLVLAALSAAQPAVVPDPEELVTANSLATTSGGLATLGGAALGAALRAVLGAQDSDIAWVIVLSAAVYLAAGLVSCALGADELGPPRQPARPAAQHLRNVARDVAAGVQQLVRAAPARNALLALTSLRLCYGMGFVSSVLLFRFYFHGSLSGLRGLGVAVSAASVGAVAAAVMTPAMTRRLRPTAWICVLLVLAGVGQVVFGLPYRPTLLVAGSAVVAFCAQGAKICTDSLVQRFVLDDARGRAFSIYDVAFNASYVLAAVITAVTVPRDGHAPAVLAGIGVGYLLTAALLAQTLAGAGSQQTAEDSLQPAHDRLC